MHFHKAFWCVWRTTCTCIICMYMWQVTMWLSSCTESDLFFWLVITFILHTDFPVMWLTKSMDLLICSIITVLNRIFPSIRIRINVWWLNDCMFVYSKNKIDFKRCQQPLRLWIHRSCIVIQCFLQIKKIYWFLVEITDNITTHTIRTI